MSDESEDTVSGALTKIEEALHWGYDHAIEGVAHLSGAEECADEYLRSHPDAEAAIESLIFWSKCQAGGAGFLSGLGGLITLPVAIPANALSVLYIQLRMIAAIAHIRGYDVRSDKVRGLVIACLCGTAALDVLKDVGINIGQKLTTQALRQISGAALIRINQAVGFRLVTRAGTTGVVNLSRLVPIIGGAVSGSVDFAFTSGIASAARSIFTPMPPQNPDAPAS